MLRAATEAAAGRLNILGVTVLTSLKDEDMQEIGVAGRLSDQVVRMASLARSAGCQGIVTSPHEALIVRKSLGEGFAIVTPGVRPAGAETHDQQRIATPGQAISNGASHIVVGRPITHSQDPASAAEAIISEMEQARNIR
jgi:orotidine-5'-phosphate decarboxylase